MINKNDMGSLIRKFVENKASEVEIGLLQEYFKTPAGLTHLDQIMNEYASDFYKAHLEPHDNPEMVVLEREHNTQHSKWRITLRLAAAIIGIAIVAGVYLFVAPIYSGTVYKTLAGQKTTITLPDNTIVTLNGSSTLSYRGDWKDEKTRTVNLTGEAYFKVTSNPQKPFVVNTSGIAIKVLGTTFNVKSYDDDEDVETTLVEGKVVIEKRSEEHTSSDRVELLPDQKATFSKNSKLFVLEQVKTEKEAAWVKGSLIFDDEAFEDIIKDLERWYGTRIVVKDKGSLQCRYNARIENETLEEVLKLFATIGNLKYTIKDNNQVLIEGGLCEKKTE